MSKISEYQAALRKMAEEQEKQTVGDFARELRKTPEALLIQLSEAGVPKSGPADVLGTADKHKLLTWLQKQHGRKFPRKKIEITVDPEDRKLTRAVAEGANGAEFEVLELLMSSVLWGEKIPPRLQKIANIVVAKSILIGALPLRKLGRPKLEGLDKTGLRAAWLYFDLVDSGSKYEAAVAAVAKEICKSERHVMRLIAKHKGAIGETIDQRKANRDQPSWVIKPMSSEVGKAATGSQYEHYLPMFGPKIPVPELTWDDYMAHLDELADALASKSKPLTKKI